MQRKWARTDARDAAADGPHMPMHALAKLDRAAVAVSGGARAKSGGCASLLDV
jgi:hypothetical protein